MYEILNSVFGFNWPHNLMDLGQLREIKVSKPIAYNSEFGLAIREGHYYLTREGKVIGPLKRAPAVFADFARDNNKPLIWYWCAAREGEDHLYWTIDGRWYEKRDKPSPNDLAQELGADEAHTQEMRWVLAQQETIDASRKSAEKPVGGAIPAAAPAPMTKRALLDLAIAATADRGLNYGAPENNFARIARRWNAHLLNKFGENLETHRVDNVYLDATDVALMCADLKIARLENSPDHQDSWVDLAGYAACGAEIALGGTGTTLEAANRQGREGDFGFKGNPRAQE